MTKLPSIGKDVKLIADGQAVIVGQLSDSFAIGATRKSKQNVPIYDERIHNYIAMKVKERAKNSFHTFILITGPRRTGKTTNAVEIARLIDPDFPTDNVCFELEEFRKLMGTLPRSDPANGRYSVGILDEGGYALYNKDWQQKASKEMGRIMQVIGKNIQTVIVCLPHRSLLIGDIREAMDYWICTTVLDGRRGFAELREGCYNKWKINLFWKPLCAFIFDECNDDWWARYEMKKDGFIHDMFQNDPNVKPSAKVARAIGQRDALIKAMSKDANHSQIEIADIVGMRKENVCRIVNER